MGYFSELSIKLQEQQELFYDARDWQVSDYPTPVQQLLWRLEDLKARLEALVCRDNIRRAVQGLPRRSWRTVYREWPEYWATGRTETYCVLPRDLSCTEEVLSAIASTQKRLFFYGVDADAEEKKRSERREPLDGQVGLPLAS